MSGGKKRLRRKPCLLWFAGSLMFLTIQDQVVCWLSVAVTRKGKPWSWSIVSVNHKEWWSLTVTKSWDIIFVWKFASLLVLFFKENYVSLWEAQPAKHYAWLAGKANSMQWFKISGKALQETERVTTGHRLFSIEKDSSVVLLTIVQGHGRQSQKSRRGRWKACREGTARGEQGGSEAPQQGGWGRTNAHKGRQGEVSSTVLIKYRYSGIHSSHLSKMNLCFILLKGFKYSYANVCQEIILMFLGSLSPCRN